MRWLRLRWRLCAALWAGSVLCSAASASPWFDGARPAPHAHEAVELLRAAHTHGLDPRDYDADALADAVSRAAGVPLVDAQAIDRLEGRLTRALRRYLADLHGGRVDPRTLHVAFRVPRDPFDADARLAAALAARRLHGIDREAAPPVPQYQRLREVLARYRAIASDAAWSEALPPLPAPRPGVRGRLEPGAAYDGLPRLAQRLAVLGDLTAVLAAPPARYDGALVDAVRAFQRRHGLDDDGVIGAATLAHLQTTPRARARQLEFALERLRWTPLLHGPRMVVINVPEFVLRAYDVQEGRIVVRHAMKVIVGKAMDTRTPLFDADLRFIEFSPYWNVPPSIARAELVPRLRRDPAYWTREDFEFVAPDGRVDAVLSAAALDAVVAGRLRIRQRPGPRNALGDIKFVFPNHDNIYLHHTPSTELFARARRDFSHGCIRVEHPVDLATFVLHAMPQWDEARVRQAMDRGESATLRLAEPVRVLIAYGTALVKDDRVHFFDDLYGHDRLLDAGLRRVAAQRLAQGALR